ncbi:hypothetical protein STCU_02352 [Strigomonas culicis]|uniref:Uncharacterized protein n=1 Tax=Strigomonas culicis TaxID=28005 RepID=S9W1D9_9TRYP|nr:hypothetical protein STCU_02352 [Strigomonas culicis]|eukprot:EPY33276.1 hypothetical protein STCU_02352 [Strigomonas culicis]
MYFLQYYSAALILADLYELYYLWTTKGPVLSNGSLWFDRRADVPEGPLLYTFPLIVFMLARLFVITDPLNRWLMFNNALLEALRVLAFSYLFKHNIMATSYNTMLLVFFMFNIWVYGRNYYTTTCELKQNMA